jgi:hypothetical protein
MNNINGETAHWQEWRGRNNRCGTMGWTVSPAAQTPRNPSITRESVPRPRPSRTEGE